MLMLICHVSEITSTPEALNMRLDVKNLSLYWFVTYLVFSIIVSVEELR